MKKSKENQTNQPIGLSGIIFGQTGRFTFSQLVSEVHRDNPTIDPGSLSYQKALTKHLGFLREIGMLDYRDGAYSVTKKE